MQTLSGFFVRILNSDRVFLDTVRNPTKLTWSYDRMGGCGACTLDAPKDDLVDINGNNLIQILQITDEIYENNKYGTYKYYAEKYGWFIPALSHWKLDELTGTTITDVVGNYTGTSSIDASNMTINGKVGTALSFSQAHTGSANVNVNCGDVTELDNTTGFSFSCWLKQEELNQTVFIFNKTDGSSDVRMYTHTSEVIYFQIRGSGADSYAYFKYDNLVTINEFFHVALVMDLSQLHDSDKVKMYLNGVRIPLTFIGDAMPSTTPNLAGNDFYLSYITNAWNGSMDNIHMYDKPIHETQVKKLYNNGNGNASTNQNTVKYGKTKGEDLWYTGYVQVIQTSDSNIKEKTVKIGGLRDRLDRVVIDAVYTSTELSEILSDIMTTVTPLVNIGLGTFEVTTFTPDTLTFSNETADRVIQKIIELAGGYEWGVDRNGELYFLTKSTTINHSFFKGVNVGYHENEDDFQAIRNSILIIGGKDENDLVFKPAAIEDADSIATFGTRQLIVQNSSVTTQAVATQLGTSLLSDLSIRDRRGSVGLPPNKRLIEKTVPLGLLAVNDGDTAVPYGTTITYGNSTKYGGAFGYQIESISYTLIGDSVITSIELGRPLTGLTDRLAQLEFTLDQQRQNIT